MFRGLRSTAPPLIQPSTTPTTGHDCGLCRAFGLELGFSDSRTRRTADLYILYSERMYTVSVAASKHTKREGVRDYVYTCMCAPIYTSTHTALGVCFFLPSLFVLVCECATKSGFYQRQSERER